MTNPVNANLIEAIQEVDDLDVIHQLTSNELIDRQAPWLRDWSLRLLEAERAARELGSGDVSQHPQLELSGLPMPAIVAGHAVAIGVCKAAYALRIETVVQFTWRLVELFVAELHVRIAIAEHGKASHAN